MKNNKIKELTKEEFRKMQLVELEMLEQLDAVCRKHDIDYCIAYGTLLGAVRHKGFIPWDDDIDVIMLREDYNKFKKFANELNSDICYLQDHDTDPEYRWGYAKLRRTNTEFVRVGQEHLKCKTGMFIDIFPLDDIPKSTIGQILNDFHCFCIRKILYSEVGRLSDSENKIQRLIYSLLSKIPLKMVFKHYNKMTKRSRNSSPNRVRAYTFRACGKCHKHPLNERYGMPKKWYKERAEYEFEGKKFYGSKDYDTVLTYAYDDYMKLPPKEERDPHSPVSSYSFDVKNDTNGL